MGGRVGWTDPPGREIVERVVGVAEIGDDGRIQAFRSVDVVVVDAVTT